ncbi:putative membrane protein [Faunimonas pinastri]|uniref:Putative membrane protein n=1 Tax=Faunimonas pinastri TaxID=1855383 RepID=A0A1H9AHH6_9HYPH|nr:lysylphosphatidylglycerol synthase domain-containing protein [Faunimonas pinastri]SEP76119.1 putative membrane protein [Faunimonas pinastri]
MKLTLALLAVAGAAAIALLVVYFGAGAVKHAIATAGWASVFAVCVAHIPSFLLCGAAWRVLLVGQASRGWIWMSGLRWARESAGTLLPVVPFSAELVGGRMMVLSGIGGGTATASMVVDLTMEALSQAVFTMAGVIAMLARGLDPRIALWTVGAMVIIVPALVGFLMAQRAGMFGSLEGMARKMAERWNRPELAGEGLEEAMNAIHAHRGRVAAGFVFHLVAWFEGMLETGLVLWLMGHPLSLADLLVLESLTTAIRSVAFFIPGALGVQEGAFLAIGALVGLPAEAALALALIKRAREIILGVPGLLLWQWQEGRSSARLWAFGRRSP